ncbi:5094_t:CDS:2 [Ambispora gerdemannii]|uniref:5094_t:CDS:1 n=1 Tax=Ambispora gerdemannii TaxID=144530 RepID=A0A9N9F5Q1_9GLOM|nr:5094_t:CDS:2 [Ambispora gerdemannii]
MIQYRPKKQRKIIAYKEDELDNLSPDLSPELIIQLPLPSPSLTETIFDHELQQKQDEDDNNFIQWTRGDNEIIVSAN